MFKKYNGNHCIDANSYNNINILTLIAHNDCLIDIMIIMIMVPKYLNLEFFHTKIFDWKQTKVET